MQSTFVRAVIVSTLLGLGGTYLSAQSDSFKTVPPVRTYLKLPLAFERHVKGVDETFIARGPGYAVNLRGGKATIGLVSGRDDTPHAISLDFVGARAAEAIPGMELPGKVNYIRGSDSLKWQTGLSTWERVRYPNVYPGIDLIYYGNQQQLEFDLMVKPGVDPKSIRMRVGGGSKLSLDESGALLIGTGGGDDLRIELPRIYQEINGGRKAVAGRYAIRGTDEVAFNVDSYDRSRALVIDPTIVYSTLFGGGMGSNGINAIKLDSMGNILIAGYTYASDFPVVNAAQDELNGSGDAFVSKINAAGTALIYSTFLGGSSFDFAEGVAVDSTGSAWVAGYTESSDFPVLNAAQPTFGGGLYDAFVARFNAAGALEFSTYLGGNSNAEGYGIAVDTSGNGYVTGYAYSQFPITSGPPQSGNQCCKAFVTKYNPTGTVLYSILLNGNSSDFGSAIAADSNGNAYVTGYTYSSTFTGAPAGGAQSSNNGAGDAFAAKLNANGTALLYFTFLGGTAFDQGKAISIDSLGNAYIAGQTGSAGLATTGAAQTAAGGGIDGFAAKLNPSGSAFSYVTYLGGSREDYLTGLALDGSGNVYLSGYTDSNNFPIVSPLQATIAGNSVSLFKSANSGSSWSAFDSTIPGAVVQISINPSDSSAVVLTESGIYRTVNGGTSWTQQYSTPFASGNAYLARSLVAPGTVYAMACCSTIYKSTDDGVTWSVENTPNQAAGILADPLNATTVYLFGSTAPYVYKSTDSGATWNPAGTGLPSSIPVFAMAAAPGGSLYAGTSGSGIYKSANQGGSWAAVNTGLPSGSNAQQNSLSASGTTVYFAAGTIYETANGGTSWAATPSFVGASVVAASPQNASILYAFTANNTVQESANGGTTWNAAGTGLPSDLNYSYPMVVVDPGNSANVYVVAPVNQIAFVTKLNSAGSALTWSTYLGGTSSTQASAIATNGSGETFVAGFTNGNGFPITSSALTSESVGAFVTEISDATASCSALTVSPGSALASQSGTTLYFNVLAPSGCAWTASTNESWAVITSGNSGTGVGVITILVSSNAGNSVNTAVLTVGSQNITITQPGNSCNYSLDSSSYTVSAAGGAVSAILTATAGCPWAVTNDYSSGISFTSASSGTGSATINMTVASNLTSNAITYNLPVGTTQIVINQSAVSPTPLQLLTVTPCRVMDTRTANGPLGGPYITGYTSRAIPIPASNCGIPGNAAAYSLNVTVVPRKGTLGYLTVWPTGQVRPVVSTLNSPDGSVLANAAIVPAGTGGSISAFATDDTDLVVDINGYFVPPATDTLQFFPLTPCRVLDTRNPNGVFGGPPLAGESSRSFPVPSSSCGAPASAAAYSLNVTVVPHGSLGYLTAWPTGQVQPLVSTLNSIDGTILANAAIVPAGAGGAVSFFAADTTDLVVDINGYFGAPATGGVNFYAITPCRLVDTRNPSGTFGGPTIVGETVRSFPLTEGPCNLPSYSAVQAYSLNMTIVPQGPLGYLTTWPAGGTQPVVSTLNAPKGNVLANAALVPAGVGGSINVFVTNTTDVVIDTNGYFGQ